MKKLSEYKNEDALDLLVDIMEPAAKIFADKQLAKAVANKCNKIEAVKIAIKNNKSAVIEVLAVLNGVEVKDYTCTVMSLIQDLLELLNDQELLDFFTSQGQMMVSESSTSATVNTKASAQ